MKAFNQFFQVSLAEINGDGLQVLPVMNDQAMAAEIASRLRGFLVGYTVRLYVNTEHSTGFDPSTGEPINYKCESSEIDFI